MGDVYMLLSTARSALYLLGVGAAALFLRFRTRAMPAEEPA